MRPAPEERLDAVGGEIRRDHEHVGRARAPEQEHCLRASPVGREGPGHVHDGCVVHCGHGPGAARAQREIDVEAMHEISGGRGAQALQCATDSGAHWARIWSDPLGQLAEGVDLHGGRHDQRRVGAQSGEELADIGLNPASAGAQCECVEPDRGMHARTPRNIQKYTSIGKISK